jgi:hypothetical protein
VSYHFQHLVPDDFADQARVWVYQSSRLFTMSEALELEEKLDWFTKAWRSHGAPVKATALLLFGQFIVLLADETTVPVGGCSTDSSVHFIKELESHYKVSLLNRLQLAFVVKDKVELLPMAQVNYAWQQNVLTDETLFFNNAITSKKELMTNWIVPISKSWLFRQLTASTSL